MSEYVGKYDFVVAAVCVRRRPWAAPLWLGAMAAQTRRPDGVLVVADEPDEEDWYSWGKAIDELERLDARPVPFRQWLVERYPHPSAPGWSRGTRESGWREVPEGVAGRYTDDQHAHLARLRGWCLDRALELWPDLSHVWIVDSDYAPDPNSLELLLGADKPVIASLVRNGERAWNFFSGENWKHDPPEPYRNGSEPLVVTCGEPVRVTMTGASLLLRRDAIEAGYRWAEDPKGEDVGAAKVARQRGIELWLHPLARGTHRMDGPDKEGLR